MVYKKAFTYFFSFKGRASRGRVIIQVAVTIATFALAISINILLLKVTLSLSPKLFYWFQALFAPALFVINDFSNMSVGVRRLHDMNVSGWFYLPVWFSQKAFIKLLIPPHVINISGLLEAAIFIAMMTGLCFVAGSPGSNKFDTITSENKSA